MHYTCMCIHTCIKYAWRCMYIVICFMNFVVEVCHLYVLVIWMYGFIHSCIMYTCLNHTYICIHTCMICTCPMCMICFFCPTIFTDFVYNSLVQSWFALGIFWMLYSTSWIRRFTITSPILSKCWNYSK